MASIASIIFALVDVLAQAAVKKIAFLQLFNSKKASDVTMARANRNE